MNGEHAFLDESAQNFAEIENAPESFTMPFGLISSEQLVEWKYTRKVYVYCRVLHFFLTHFSVDTLIPARKRLKKPSILVA